ncbi:MAG: TRAP transporter large permease [Candidatus Methylomirabilales bacterium]
MTLTLLVAGFLLLSSLGMPVAYAIGVTSVLLLLVDGLVPLVVAPQRMFVVVNSFALMAIPFFLLAGEFMNTGGITRRLVNLSDALVGHIRGGLAHVVVVAEMFLSGISGSSAADASAVGGMLIPAMVQKGYNKNFSVAINCAASTLGPIIPPSIIMIIYGSLTGVSIGALFLGGVVPGVLIGGGMMAASYLLSRQGRYVAEPRPPASWGETRAAFREASLALLLPLVILGGIITGIFTATEAGAVAAVLSLILGVFVYKELSPRDIFPVVLRAASGTAVVMLLCATAAIFGWILAKERFGDLALAGMQAVTTSPLGIMLLVGVLLLIVGCFVDTVASTIILIPVLHPVMVKLGFDPIHFGVIAVILITLGGLTPPVAPLLYIASTIAKSPALEALPLVLLFMAIILAVTGVLILYPPLVTYLPSLFF